MVIQYRNRSKDWSNRSQWNVDHDRDHSQIKFEKANLVEFHHDYSNVKLLTRPEYSNLGFPLFSSWNQLPNVWSLCLSRIRRKASPISQCLITQMSTPWLMESMKLRSEMTQNRRLVKARIHHVDNSSTVLKKSEQSIGMKLAIKLNPWPKESLTSSFGEISPGPEPLIYANLPVKQ